MKCIAFNKLRRSIGVEIRAQKNNGPKITRDVFYFKKVKKPFSGRQR